MAKVIVISARTWHGLNHTYAVEIAKAKQADERDHRHQDERIEFKNKNCECRRLPRFCRCLLCCLSAAAARALITNRLAPVAATGDWLDHHFPGVLLGTFFFSWGGCVSAVFSCRASSPPGGIPLAGLCRAGTGHWRLSASWFIHGAAARPVYTRMSARSLGIMFRRRSRRCLLPPTLLMGANAAGRFRAG